MFEVMLILDEVPVPLNQLPLPPISLSPPTPLPSQAGRARRAPRPSYPPCALSRIKWHTLTFLAVVVQPLTDRCPCMKVVAGLFKMSRDGAEGWLLNRTHLSFASRVCFRTRPGFLIINFFIDVILHSDLSGFSLLFLYE